MRPCPPPTKNDVCGPPITKGDRIFLACAQWGAISIIVLSFLLSGCAGTGLGRAWDQAWNGTPPEVVDAVQFMDRTMSKDLREKYAAIESADVTDPTTGQVNHEWAENRFRDLEATHAQIERWRALSGALAAYLGVTLTEPIDFSARQADIRREEFWKAVQKAVDTLKKPTENP